MPEPEMLEDPPIKSYPYKIIIVMAKVGRVLELNQIPYVLGCNANMNFVVPSDRKFIEFVVPDEQVSMATKAIIAQVGLRPCARKNCYYVRPNYFPMPEKHFHYGLDESSVFCLLKKSAVYWSLPDLPMQTPAAGDRHYTLSNDSRLASLDRDGWPLELYPVKTLTPTALVESLIMLMCRDVDKNEETDCVWSWFTWLCIVAESPGRNQDYRVPRPEDLCPTLQRCWRTFLNPPELLRDQTRIQAFRDLRDERLRVCLQPPSPPDSGLRLRKKKGK